jgi:hypothetical protein
VRVRACGGRNGAYVRALSSAQDIDLWEAVWTSKGSGARAEVSVWAGHSEGKLLKRNKYRALFGMFAVKGYGKPHKNKPPKELKAKPSPARLYLSLAALS